MLKKEMNEFWNYAKSGLESGCLTYMGDLGKVELLTFLSLSFLI